MGRFSDNNIVQCNIKRSIQNGSVRLLGYSRYETYLIPGETLIPGMWYYLGLFYKFNILGGKLRYKSFGGSI